MCPMWNFMKRRREVCTVYTRQQIIDLTRKAADNPAIKNALVKEAVRQANIVNNRIKRLNAAGFGDIFGTQARIETFALENYKSTNLTKSKVKLSSDMDLLQEQLLLTSKFLRANTTVTRARNRAEEVAKILNVDLKPGKNVTFLRFLESDIFNELRRAGSPRFIQDAVEAINEGATIEQLEASYDKYLHKQSTLLESFEEWAKVK